MNSQNHTDQQLSERPLTVGTITPGGLSTLTQVASPTLDDIVEALLAWAQETVGSQEIVNALEHFHQTAGKVFHDDAFYETRISYFFDYFLFERQLPGRGANHLGGMTPYALLMSRLETQTEALPPELKERVKAIGGYRHSIFQILKVGEHTLKVQDLLKPAKYVIKAKAGETYRGFEKGDIFQSFLFPNGEFMNVSQGIVVHPPKAYRVLKKQLRASQKQPGFAEDAVLCRLARQQIRYLRHRHVDPRTIYQTEPR